jgi:hypothetical protein
VLEQRKKSPQGFNATKVGASYTARTTRRVNEDQTGWIELTDPPKLGLKAKGK